MTPPAGPFADWMRSNATNIPMLPEVATRVISLASNPDITISQLAQVISKDQVLTTRLLSLANSAYYASASTSARCLKRSCGWAPPRCATWRSPCA